MPPPSVIHHPSAPRSPRGVVRAALAGTLLLLLAIATAGCGASAGSESTVTLRLGYLPNLTHAPALVGLQRGILARDLGPSVKLQTQVFSAGPSAITAMIAGSLDAAFVGPSPAINGYVKGQGRGIRIVAGVASGGAGLVVRPAAHISTPADLRGRTLATPQLGNTQDVALRMYLRSHGLTADLQGGGDVKITPTDNATALQLFRQGDIDGAWVPEPFLSRLMQESGGTLLVDEANLWPGGSFATTELAVTERFLAAHPDVVRSLITADADAVAFIGDHPAEAKTAVNDQLLQLTQKKLAVPVLDAAWRRLTFTVDPLTATFRTEAVNAERLGLLAGGTSLQNIADLRQLNDVLRQRGQSAISANGLGLS